MVILGIVLGGLGLLGFGYYCYSPPWAYLRHRPPDVDRWKTRYPPEALPTVMAALQAIRDAFLLRHADVYRLQPQDRLHTLYQAAYRRGGPDALEFEQLAHTLATVCGVPQEELQRLTEPTVADVIHYYLASSRTGMPSEGRGTDGTASETQAGSYEPCKGSG